ncbi:MAG: hypothetical protein UX13_C0004G0014 [Candidatus Woesebacteria bacterium GW2011_GWB1_45_5]|uniref:Uncharacterized protein n=1 Tax=Candidatus Woesebacteria bacterium GW2011_GWB1_45_5 TaxID=1618581 RepID=A0A0G1MRL4_9BACT|nr:MAG: hypothetical protein UX13_C0004G0014 [Candidatus Woesebacteria bacterium GW2011_GWB1_45_5]
MFDRYLLLAFGIIGAGLIASGQFLQGGLFLLVVLIILLGPVVWAKVNRFFRRRVYCPHSYHRVAICHCQRLVLVDCRDRHDSFPVWPRSDNRFQRKAVRDDQEDLAWLSVNHRPLVGSNNQIEPKQVAFSFFEAWSIILPLHIERW